VKHRVPGTYNVAGDGVLALSEVAGLLGKPYAPVLPPWGTGLATSVLRRLGVEVPPEAVDQMRYGRGVENRRFKALGFHYQHTSRETVMKLGEYLRIHPVVRGAQEPYRYEREVEDFLRWSPHVKNARDKDATALSRDQLAELQRLLTSFADTAGMDLASEPGADRVAEAERRAAAAEESAREAAERAARAEEAVAEGARHAQERAAAAGQAAEERARKASERAEARARRAAEERAQEAENRAREAEARARRAAEERAREAEERAREAAERPAPSGRPVEHYDDLAAEEVIALLASLEHDDLQTLREYERVHANRARVLSAIESVLARGGSRV
jgi:hypothetical protein